MPADDVAGCGMQRRLQTAARRSFVWVQEASIFRSAASCNYWHINKSGLRGLVHVSCEKIRHQSLLCHGGQAERFVYAIFYIKYSVAIHRLNANQVRIGFNIYVRF